MDWRTTATDNRTSLEHGHVRPCFSHQHGVSKTSRPCSDHADFFTKRHRFLAFTGCLSHIDHHDKRNTFCILHLPRNFDCFSQLAPEFAHPPELDSKKCQKRQNFKFRVLAVSNACCPVVPSRTTSGFRRDQNAEIQRERR